MPNQEIVEYLVISILAIYGFSLEKVFAFKSAFAKAKLFDLETLKNTQHDQLFNKLTGAGFNRGGYLTGLFTMRLNALGKELTQDKLKQLGEALNKKDTKTIEDVLDPIYGIGPVVIKNFLLLSGIE